MNYKRINYFVMEFGSHDSFTQPYHSNVIRKGDILKVTIFKNNTRIATISLNIETFEIKGKINNITVEDFVNIWKKLRYFFDTYTIIDSKKKNIEFEGRMNGKLTILMSRSFHDKLLKSKVVLI